MRLTALVLAAAFSASACVDNPVTESPIDPGESLPGGDTTNTFLFGTNAFIRHVENITPENESLFFTGNSFFNQPWVTAPSSTETRDGLGPLFNSRSCAGCHFKDGRGQPPAAPGEPFEGLLLRISRSGAGAHGAPVPDPTYGGQLQPHGIDGVPGEARQTVTYDEVTGSYADGEEYELLRPRYELANWNYGAPQEALLVSPRVAPQMIGLGLLEAVPVERLEELADPDDDDGDGISGRIARVWHAERETMAVGRFGWKAEQPTIRQQTAAAFLGDIGITSEVFGAQNCTDAQTECVNAVGGGAPELEPHLFRRVVAYSSLLAVPSRRDFDDEDVLAGKQLFSEIGCAACHTPRHVTKSNAAFAELEDQTIWPYTDLLLHDMGSDLADERPVFNASGSEWRTPPLWGIGFFPSVNGHQRLLHDGRARGVAEAILWHGGESAPARDEFERLNADEREQLILFVESL